MIQCIILTVRFMTSAVWCQYDSVTLMSLVPVVNDHVAFKILSTPSEASKPMGAR